MLSYLFKNRAISVIKGINLGFRDRFLNFRDEISSKKLDFLLEFRDVIPGNRNRQYVIM